jgi:hypothetical protein
MAREELIQQLREEVEERTSRISILQDEIMAAREDLRSYAIALAALTGDRQRAPKVPKKKTTYQSGKRINEDRLGEVERTIWGLIEDRDSFRQVDVRSRMNITSGDTAVAFGQLRDAGVIRLVRQDGNSKWFGLTPLGVRRIPAELNGNG